jgi:acetyl esterase/lipase
MTYPRSSERPANPSASITNFQELMVSRMKPILFALCFTLVPACIGAQTPAWQPSRGHMQMPIWPGTPPDARPFAGPEFTITTGADSLVAGKPWISAERVARPTLTVYSPRGKNTGAAVVVFPGGGYQILAMDLEGTEVCDWLTSRGITCVLLKYRVPGEPRFQGNSEPRFQGNSEPKYQAPGTGRYPKSGPYPESPEALEDAQRAMGLVRLHAAAWHIDPHKVGVLGFSAGGHLVAALSVHFQQRLYPAVDAADNQSCRPDFAVAIYPGHLSLGGAEWDANQGVTKLSIPHPEPETAMEKEYGLNPDLHVTRQTPPTFLVYAEDDHEDNVDNALAYYIALKTAGVPVEMHLYAQGGHAFGLRRTRYPITAWPQLVDTWLSTIGITPP